MRVILCFLAAICCETGRTQSSALFSTAVVVVVVVEKKMKKQNTDSSSTGDRTVTGVVG